MPFPLPSKSLEMTLGSSVASRPEMRLLLLCARTRLDSDTAEEIRATVRHGLDWPYLFAAADKGYLAPLLFFHLSSVCTGVPQPWIEQLTETFRKNSVRTLYLTTELFRILDGFGASGIQVVPYKGPVLAAQAYGDVALRQFDDLDVILRQGDLPKAHDVMRSLGYRAQFPESLERDTARRFPGEYAFLHEGGRSRVELHTKCTLRHFPTPLNFDELAERLEVVSLAGRAVQTFSAEDGLSILCVHAAKDFWERLSWVVDIAELAQIPRGIDWEQARLEARRLGAERMMNLGLLLACDLLGTALPEETLRRVQADRAANSLAVQVRDRLLGERAPKTDLVHRAWFRVCAARSFPAGVRYLLRLAIPPKR
jgi:hypothetical protein